MPVLTRDQAVELLTREVREDMPIDEVGGVYNEMFPNAKVDLDEALRNPQPLREKMATYLAGLEPALLVHEWSLVIPRHLGPWYNEEDDVYNYTPMEEFKSELRDE